MNYHFIKTTDEETRDKLLKAGFQLIAKDGNTYTFLNDKNVTFEKETKVNYSNQLNI